MSKLELSFQSKILKFRSSAFVTQNEGDIPKSVLDEYIKIEPQFNDAYMKCKKTCVDIVDLINEMGMAPKINKPLDIYISNTTVKERTVTYENELRKFYKTYVTYQKDNKQLNILTFEDFQKQYTPKSRLSFTDKILTGIYNLFKKTTWIPEDSPQINPTEAKLIIPVDMFMKGDSLNISPEYGLISFKKPFSGHENLTVSENEIFKFIFLHEIGHLVFNNIYSHFDRIIDCTSHLNEYDKLLWLKTFEEGFCEAYAHNVLFFESIVLNHSKQYLEALKTLREPDYGEIKHGNPYNFSLLYEQLEDKFNTKHLDSNNLSDEIIPTCVTLSLNNANDVLSKYQNELLSDQSAIKIFTDESSIVLKTQTLNTKIEPFIQPIQKIKENISALRNKNDSLKIGISKKTNNQ